MMLRLEELDSRMPEPLDFLGIANASIGKVSIENKARANYQLNTSENWNNKMHEEFKVWCGDASNRWYPMA